MLRLTAIAALVVLGALVGSPPAGAAGDPATAPGPAPPPAAMSAVPEGARAPARLDDGSRVALPPIVISQAPPAADRRPVYIVVPARGGGLPPG
jgi:hypothetical protein